MKKKLKYIESKYIQLIPTLLVTASAFVILHLWYRYNIYILIQSIYAELSKLSFWNYFLISAYYDSITVIILLLLLSLILILRKKFSGPVSWLISGIFISGVFIWFLSGIEFFRIYETTFQLSFLTEENTTGITELLGSLVSELPAYYFAKILIMVPLIILTATAFYKLSRKKSYQDRFITENKLGKKNFYYSIPFFIAVLLIVIFACGSNSRYIKAANLFPHIPSKKVYGMLSEISMNPVYNVITLNFEAGTNITGSDIKKTESNKFTFKLDTRSIASKKIYPRLNILPKGKKYNIILYFFESTPEKYMDIKIKNKPVVPTWHRLAKNSIVMKNHYTNYPLSANCMFSILTSAYDHYSRKTVIQKYPNIKIKATSEILKDRGYRTCLIHTGDLRYAGQRRYLNKKKFDRIIEYDDLKKTPPYNNKVGWGVDERAMIKPGIKFAKKNKKPFFLVYLPVNPHHPYKIPDQSFNITGDFPPGINYKKKNWLNYLNSLHFADAALGNIIDSMEKEGLMENTLLFVFADHGEAFYQHRKNYNHPFYLYEENVHVPLMIYNKRLIRKTFAVNKITRHIDILPTIQDILGIDQGKMQEGKSILAAGKEEMALLHTYWKDDFLGIRDSRWKYICRMKDGYEELYDLDKDPDEKENVAGTNNKLVKKYREFIKKGRQHKINFFNTVLNK